jgi:histidyl-tRNA synthetase
MYTFSDRSGRSLTLRPEGTAPVCRAYVEHGMHRQPQPVKLWYTGPMFRYEAPQSGRFRQHSQVGAEIIGSDEPAADAELIDLLVRIYELLGLPALELHVSSIGDPASRAEYTRELRDFLLSTEVFDAEQRARIDVNPMRAFDWEGEQVRAVTEQAPKMLDRLSEDDRQHFGDVRAMLDCAGIQYQLDPRLVRGLDYYTRTVFEFKSSVLGAQTGVGGGGRYDRLIEQIGGDPTPAAGWATGLERIAQAMESAPSPATAEMRDGSRPQVVFVLTEPAAKEPLFGLLSELRRHGIGATMDLGGRSLKGQMRQADRIGAEWVVIVGPDEWSRRVSAVRDMVSQTQEEVELDRLRDNLLARVVGRDGRT